MLLREEQADRFAHSFLNVLHYAAVGEGLVAPDVSQDDFMAGGAALLFRSQIMLLKNKHYLDEFTEDLGAIGQEEVYLSTIRALRHGWFRALRVMRDTPEFTVCHDEDAKTFLHLNGLNGSLCELAGMPWSVVLLAVMPFEGEMIHTGMLVPRKNTAPLDAAAAMALEAEYEKAVQAGKVQKAWGPGTGSMVIGELPRPVRNIVNLAVPVNRDLALSFLKLVLQSPGPDTFIELCLEHLLLLRHRPWVKLQELFADGSKPSHDEVLDVLDRMEKKFHALVRRRKLPPRHWPKGRRSPEETRRLRDGPQLGREPVTLAERLHAAVPFQVTAMRELSQLLREEGAPITMKTVLTVTRVEEGPVEAGILCTVAGPASDAVIMVPLTYLVFPSRSPFFGEVAQWQRKRHKLIQRLNAR